ncbi:uncharacterized protein THITE_2117384 [Thermothielavioides terrestris NRRL 8126]|uniref:Uncharacterized protein n=1 Tax=Thermothielavioides terrestris (strain ATCC 38088 / NRRL 8126) TaxID=578455 RepID=G2R800_THETT|nr:uncharacterized protein THITE_2117384 [Thermothielavioides terrestris NRRL 8126]AEO68059.1 hypothetical protein THITE_2117384 [Thermothielavioides terrestris NRRL 8126]
MSSLDLDQVLYARARWRKAVLVPLWTFQLAVLLGLMGIFAYRLAETFEHYEEKDQLGQVPIVEVVWEATNVGFNLIALVLNIVEIAHKATERLTPFTMVCTHVVKLTLSLAVLALDIVAYLQHMDGEYSTIGLALDCGLLAATIGAFIYALTVYRRLLKYEEYHLTANAKGHGYVTGGPRARESVELGYNRAGAVLPVPITSPEYRYSDSGYPSQTTGTLPAIRTSDASLKQEVDRALGHEFGWSSSSSGPGAAASNAPAGPHHQHHQTSNAGSSTGRSGSVVVASGTVAHHGLVAAPAPSELHRQRSWVTERGVIAEGDEEADEDEDGNGGEEDGGDGRVMGRVGGEAGQARVEDREGLLRG